MIDDGGERAASCRRRIAVVARSNAKSLILRERLGGECMQYRNRECRQRMPVARINGVGYYLDGQLRQLRAVCNPDDWVDFEPDEIEPWRAD